MPEPQHQPLLSSQTSVNMGPAEGDSNKRALKVAGFTVLACALIAGQALTAYFLLSQKSQINSLEDNADSLKKQISHRQSGGSSAGMAMQKPMSSMARMTDEDYKPKEPSVQKPCLQQALAAGSAGSRPQCDEQGNFLPMQCQQKPEFCWCVRPNGQMILGTGRAGKVNCGGRAMAPSMAHMPAMSMLETKNDD